MADEEKFASLIEFLAKSLSDNSKKLEEELQSFRQLVCASKFCFLFPIIKTYFLELILQCRKVNPGEDMQNQQIRNTATDQNKETEAVRFYKGVDLFDPFFSKYPKDAGKKLRKKLWSSEGLVNTMISPTKANQK